MKSDKKVKAGVVYQHYGISDERGLRLYAELVVYMLQRCMCTNCHHHFREEKVVRMMENWSGSSLSALESAFLWRCIGAIMDDMMGFAIVQSAKDIDLGMGAEYCIQKLQKYYGELTQQFYAEQKQSKPECN